MKKKPSKVPLVLVGASAFLAGGGLALLYVFAHPVTVHVQGKTACMFMLPKSFAVPEES